jgi:hypothetical protein
MIHSPGFLVFSSKLTQLSQVFEFRVDKLMNRRPERPERLVMSESLAECPERAERWL